MKIAGLDFSIKSPSLCIGSGSNNFSDCFIYLRNDTVKQITKIKNIVINPTQDYENFTHRFDLISDYFIEWILAHQVEKVFLEDYSLGARKGQVFQIAEATGLMKYKLYRYRVKLEVISPKQLKKFFTGNGNSDKISMVNEFTKRTGIDLEDLGIDKVDDIVDSYALYLKGLELNEGKVSEIYSV